MDKLKKINKYQLIVILLAVFVATLNIWRVIVGAFHVPQGYAYLAVAHYFSDYFEYVQQLAQGIRGHWLVDNPYGIGDPTRTLIGWGQYLLYGRLASIFGWSPFLAYWIVIFVLGVILCLLLFKLVKKLLPQEPFVFQLGAFLLALFATPFIKLTTINGLLKIVPYDVWYSPMSIFHRFGGVPHHLTTNIMVAALLLLIAKILDKLGGTNRKNLVTSIILICFTMIIFLTFGPFQVINLLAALIILSWIYANQYILKKDKFKLTNLFFIVGLIMIAVVPTALVIKILHQSGDLFHRTVAWEVSQQNYPSIFALLAMTGPILIFIPFGLKSFFKSASPIRLLFLLYAVISYSLYYTPLSILLGTHNARFINPVSYVLFGVLAFLGMKSFSSLFVKRKMVLTGTIIIFLTYFFVVTVVIYRSFGPLDQLSYLKKDLLAGMKKLEEYQDNKNVMTSPKMALGAILPILVERRVYLGRSMFTPDFENRFNISDRFYQGMLTSQDAQQLIENNNIGYVILSPSIEGYDPTGLEKYLFLKKIFENSEIKIYRTF